MDELRWILLALGAVIVIGVYGYSRWQEWRREGMPWSRPGSEKREPFADQVEPGLDDEDPLVAEPVEAEPAVPEASPESDEEKVVVLTVMAKDRAPYPLADLMSVLEDAGLKRTEQHIYRRGLDTGSGTVALYTVANILEPGTFEAEPAESASTPGVALILQLPGPFDGLVTFEQMLATAQRIADQLGGHVLDSRRCDLTAQSIEHIREDLLEYRRRARLASRQGA